MKSSIPSPASWLCAALLVTACGGSGASRPEPGTTNVLLVVVDTLGAKHLGSYGGDAHWRPAASPRLDQLARESVRFERAYSSAPWTQPSVASLMTSRMPSRHRVQNLLDSLPEDERTLAEALSEGGYATHAVISHHLINQEFGFQQGFTETFDTDGVRGHDGITSEIVTDRAMEVLDGAGEDPFFLFVHYFDPHFLYHHHEDYDRTSGYGGNLRPAMPVWQLRDVRELLTPLDLEYVVGLYQEEVAYTDHHIGRLLDHLAATGLEDDTLVVFTADHGEEFMEHGWIGHTRNLYDDLIRVPLLVRLPGRIAPAVVAEPVSTIDVAPTVLDLVLGSPFGPQAEGRALTATLLDGTTPERRALHAEVSFAPVTGDPARTKQKEAFMTAIVYGDQKLVHDLSTDEWLHFRHGDDPGEDQNVYDAGAESSQALRARLEAWEASHRPRSAGSGDGISEEELARLRDLGYVR